MPMATIMRKKKTYSDTRAAVNKRWSGSGAMQGAFIDNSN